MNRVKVLDCTLRDGGYVNNWDFGEQNIRKIISKLDESGVDIVECGFISSKLKYDKDNSRFDSVERVSTVIPSGKRPCMYVAMINYGEVVLDDIPDRITNYIDGIRVAFHKKDIEEALALCDGIAQKGYKVFIQPMVSVSYTDKEFIELISMSNRINPYAFYIVDSFGVMKRNDLLRLFYLVDHNLAQDIYVGYHSHNNMQLSYSNSQSLVDLKTRRKLIIDASVYGMGRGAGNLNTELFIEYLNLNNGTQYKSIPLLQIIDEVLNYIYAQNYWGYSFAHFLSAKYNCHPNYATDLSKKDTLTAEDVSNILLSMDDQKRSNYSESYIEKLYQEYQAHRINDEKCLKELEHIFKNKNIVAIASGNSVSKEKKKINKIRTESNTLFVAVNYIPKDIQVDYIFISNLKRYEHVKGVNRDKLITTSNVQTDRNIGYAINYLTLINEHPAVSDNAGLMLIKLACDLGVKKIRLAGYDGYSYDAMQNYAEEDMAFIKDKTVVDNLNAGMTRVLKQYSERIDIQFVTESKYNRDKG